MTTTNGPFVVAIITATKLSSIAAVRSTVVVVVATMCCYVIAITLMIASKFSTAWTVSRRQLPNLWHYASRLVNGPQMRHFSTFWLDCWMI